MERCTETETETKMEETQKKRTKVSDLDVHVLVKEDVFRLEITMDDVVPTHDETCTDTLLIRQDAQPTQPCISDQTNTHTHT